MLNITDYYELLALHKALMEAKFNNDPNNFDMMGSPIISNISNRIIDAIIKAEESKGDLGSEEKWNKWRRIDRNRREWEVTINEIKKTSMWQTWSENEKIQYLQTVLSPLVADNYLLKELL